jgi:molybdenum cofactor guanylyltransferase
MRQTVTVIMLLLNQVLRYLLFRQKMPSYNHSCIILAGGEGKRMRGADKGLAIYQHKPLIEHMISIAQSCCDDIIISANRNIDSYARYGYPVIRDNQQAYRGPLAGIAACLPYCKHRSCLILPCDMPRLSGGLLAKLLVAKKHEIAILQHGSHKQLVMAIDTGLAESINEALRRNHFSIMQWVSSREHDIVSVNEELFFANLNHTGDLE